VSGGWPGEIAVRLQRDAIAHQPTVVTVMLGMNDAGYRPFDPAMLAKYADGYRAIVKTLKEALPGVRLTLIRPSPFDDVARLPQFARGFDDVLRRHGCFAAGLARREGALAVDFRDPVNTGVAALVVERA
jgi:lysophospholipase L1-like esterase